MAGEASSRAWLRWAGAAGVAVLAGWLLVKRGSSVGVPRAAVGHWRSRDGASIYQQAYAEVLAAIPPADARLDTPTVFGTVRVLHWDAPGAGTPVVLLPGRSSGAPMWAENLPDWIGERPVYALDPLGDAGLSSQRVPLTRFEDQADWIGEVLDGLQLRRAHVVGHSFGGATAAILAVRHPDRVATLTLLEPVFVVEPPPASVYLWATLTQLPVPQPVKDRALAEIGGTTVEEVRRRTPMSALIDAAASYRVALPTPRTLSDEEWRSLPMPVRVDLAASMSLAGGESAAARVRSLLPAAIVTVWPGATHSLPMQKRLELDSQVLQFWNDHA